MRYLAHLRVIMSLATVLGIAVPTGARASSSGVSDDFLKDGFALRPLDGATIRAVEKYANPDPNSLGFSAGVYPFDPYYLAFIGSADYTYQFDETIGWEVMSASYAFPVDKGLVEEIAAAGARPQDENRLQFFATTNILYAFAYGKALLFKDYIRYFRASALAGLGAAGTEDNTSFGLNMGLRFEFYAAENFSWRFEFRNLVTVTNGSSTYPSFNLGIGIGL